MDADFVQPKRLDQKEDVGKKGQKDMRRFLMWLIHTAPQEVTASEEEEGSTFQNAPTIFSPPPARKSEINRMVQVFKPFSSTFLP